uniref:ATP synthase F1 complex delta/epsilon subunit N-terminal domain-containing protein n=1 Tax=Aegilops tauschii subsp. strangulata TaxID=200361 RepID=A0A452YMG6_AEGTS
MKLNLYVLTPKRIIWDCEVKEIILSTNSGQIGVLPNHAPINTEVDMGPLRIRLLNDQWLTAVLWSGFARIVNNEIIILGNDAELGSDIDPEEAQKALEIAEANLSKAEGTKEQSSLSDELGYESRLSIGFPHPI